jgi:hypothetical protein
VSTVVEEEEQRTRTGKHWSDEEDAILWNYIVMNRGRLGVFGAMRELAESDLLVDRSFHKCKNRYYSHLLPREGVAAPEDFSAVMESADTEDEQWIKNLDSRPTQEVPAQNAEVTEEIQFFERDTDKSDPYIRVEILPLAREQLDVMDNNMLFDLLLNVVIKIQDNSNKTSLDLERTRRDLRISDSEKEEYKVGYMSLLNVINTARRMAISEDSPALGSGKSPRFRMDVNGNLESV